MIYSALIAIGLLFIVNPDAFIARTNIDHLANTSRIDERYLLSLSSDAVPVLLAHFSNDTKPSAATFIQQMTHHPRWINEGNWRDWNMSRARAYTLLESE
ncbi:MAG: hypothetical protein ACI915_000059 [Gammaproteobacteria bacterium]